MLLHIFYSHCYNPEEMGVYAVVVLSGPFAPQLAAHAVQAMGEATVSTWDAMQTQADINAIAAQHSASLAIDTQATDAIVASTLEAVVLRTCTPVLIITNYHAHLPASVTASHPTAVVRHVWATSTWHGMPGQRDIAPATFETLLCGRDGPTPQTQARFVMMLDHSAARGSALDVPSVASWFTDIRTDFSGSPTSSLLLTLPMLSPSSEAAAAAAAESGLAPATHQPKSPAPATLTNDDSISSMPSAGL